MLNTVVRQIAFSSSSGRVHDARKEGELTPTISATSGGGAEGEPGAAFNYPDEYRTYWSYIPHFVHVHVLRLRLCLRRLPRERALQALRGGPGGLRAPLLAMLERGTARHKELLAPFGLDASDPAFWDGGLEIIEGFIEELEQALDADREGVAAGGSPA
jgi:oligoendopeptidase F